MRARFYDCFLCDVWPSCVPVLYDDEPTWRASSWRELVSSVCVSGRALEKEKNEIPFKDYRGRDHWPTYMYTASLHGMGGQYGMGKNVLLLFSEH